MSPRIIEDDVDWRLFAACRGMDPEFFYPERGESTAPAKAVCATCTVKEECLEYALVSGEKFGIFGGRSERERRIMRRRRRRLGIYPSSDQPI